MIKYDEMRFLVRNMDKVRENGRAHNYLKQRLINCILRGKKPEKRVKLKSSYCYGSPDLYTDDCYYDGNPVR